MEGILMKKILSITLCAILLSMAFVVVRLKLTPVLMRNANHGMNSLKMIENVDNLFIGSSMFRQGIDAQALSTEEEDAFLLSYNGNQPFLIYYEIKELLDNGVNIGTLYVDMYAYSLTSNTSLSDVRLLQENNLDFTYTVYKTMNKNKNANLLDLYEMVVKSNNEMFLSWPISYPLINSRYVRGSNNTKNAGATEEALKQLPLNFGESTPKEVQLESLDKLIALCKENNVNIVFLETPKYSYLYEGESYRKIMIEYVDFLDKYNVKQVISQETSSHCGILENKNHIIYSFDSNNPAFFTDLIHMSSDGRETFSVVLKQLFSSFSS